MMIMKRNKPVSFTALLLLLSVAGCRGPLPCTGCEEQGDENQDQEEEEAPPDDLPCGGADFMTDNLNCGACENECTVWFEGTPYEAGGCAQGECSRSGWFGCAAQHIGASCADVCGSRKCLPGGCSGYTGLVFETGHFEGCPTDEIKPVVVLKGACDEPTPWDIPGTEFIRQARCCCEY
jgi:hypothetical protein